MNVPKCTDGTLPVLSGTHSGCRICTIRLEQLCYRRAWWFRACREILASGIRLFALAYRIPADRHPPRSALCFRCLRFRKNALKDGSRLFNWLDGYLNPFFNRVRDSLLTADELKQARRLAEQAADPAFGIRLAEIETPTPNRSTNHEPQ